MLRRSYSFEDGETGLFFVSFQNELSTFVSTLERMATSDALLEFTTTTRSATFLVLPGFDADRRLGASLFASRELPDRRGAGRAAGGVIHSQPGC